MHLNGSLQVQYELQNLPAGTPAGTCLKLQPVLFEKPVTLPHHKTRAVIWLPSSMELGIFEK
jgi:hypothetical protein